VLFDAAAVITAVTAVFQLDPGDILGRLKQAHISEARGVCFWLLRRHSRLPLKHLGAALNRKDHSTPLRAVMRCEERRMRDAWFREVTDRLERELELKSKGEVAA
jgi:chromosomal replication initiator protein